VRAAIRAITALVTVAAVAGCGASGGQVVDIPSPVPVPTTATTSAAPPSAADPPTPTTGPTGLPVQQVVPNVVGLRLPAAKARLAAQGYPEVNHVYANGQGRHVVDADNWVVQSQVPAAGSPLTPGTPVTVRIGKPTDGAASGTVTAGVVPNVVCKELSSAKELLKRAGFVELSAQDATGQGRHQILDTNWIVVAQSVAPGRRADPVTPIVLSVVKYGEPTGRSGCAS
jgi:beta-lactam-binding protein with PASTA domain